MPLPLAVARDRSTARRLPDLLLVLLLTARTATAQGPMPPDQPDRTLDAPTRSAVIEAARSALDRGYVFPEVARKMADDLKTRLARGEYDAITSARQFAATVTDHLRAISHDKHLGLHYRHEPMTAHEGGDDAPPPPELRERMRQFGSKVNFGFERVERLPGNVGYLELRGFMPPDLAGETATAAMSFLAHTDALIIDLRQNGGGDPAMVAYLTSYLFDGEPVHLNDLYFRPDDSTRQWWTLPHVPGRRFGPDKPVYILTSARTFSAAEEFSYNLKNLKRATIVGETTGGGAHPGGVRRLHDHFGMFVPSGRAINPISKTNWEGTGVAPDRSVEAAQALTTAHLDALETLLPKAQKTKDPRAGDIERKIRDLKRQLAKPDPATQP